MRRILKVITSILICIAIYAIVAAIHDWSIGSVSPLGAFIYTFIMALIFGSWLFLIALYLLSALTSFYKKATPYVYILAGSIMECVLPIFTGMNFFDIQGFSVDFIGYVLSGAMFGWLYYYWLLKNNEYGET